MTLLKIIDLVLNDYLLQKNDDAVLIRGNLNGNLGNKYSFCHYYNMPSLPI
ncbi:hypothetical protein CMALT394_250121 [Carnobacterium maltaromaticum]|nr:hypothetical protein CMALT394_250121 [Carnobacterium maltaromaticum]